MAERPCAANDIPGVCRCLQHFLRQWGSASRRTSEKERLSVPFRSLALFGRFISPATLRLAHPSCCIMTAPSYPWHYDRPVLLVADHPILAAALVRGLLGSKNRKSVWIARFLRLGIVVSPLDRNPRRKTAGNHLNSGSFFALKGRKGVPNRKKVAKVLGFLFLQRIDCCGEVNLAESAEVLKLVNQKSPPSNEPPPMGAVRSKAGLKLSWSG